MTAVKSPRLPARPLVEAIDRMFTRADEDDRRGFIYEEIQLNPRRLWEWRKPGAQVQADTADRVLSNSPYLWFDVWLECPQDAEHQVVVMDTGQCPRCDAYARARLAFTGQKTRKKRRPK